MTGLEFNERDLLEQGITPLMDLLGNDWRLRLQQDETEAGDRGIDALLRVGQSGGQQVLMIVEARSNLTRWIRPERSVRGSNSLVSSEVAMLQCS